MTSDVATDDLSRNGGDPAFSHLTVDDGFVPPHPPAPREADGDNVVEGANLSFLLSVFGAEVASLPAAAAADINGDGVVNGADLSVLLATVAPAITTDDPRNRVAGARASNFFEARSADAGSLGSPISYTGTLYQDAAGNNVGPNPFFIGFIPALEFDSYVAVDTGPSTAVPAFQANGTTPVSFASAGGPFNNPGQISNLWFINGEAGAIPNAAFGGAHALFLGRFSFQGTAGNLSLGANGVVVDIVDPGTTNVGSPNTDSLLVKFTAFNTTVQSGLDGGDLSTHPTAFPYQLRLNSFQTSVGGNTYFVNDLYVVQIPTPGTIALAGLGGLLVARRRRA